eukprot:7101985-Prymnesium_polylepis.1
MCRARRARAVERDARRVEQEGAEAERRIAAHHARRLLAAADQLPLVGEAAQQLEVRVRRLLRLELLNEGGGAR